MTRTRKALASKTAARLALLVTLLLSACAIRQQEGPPAVTTQAATLPHDTPTSLPLPTAVPSTAPITTDPSPGQTTAPAATPPITAALPTPVVAAEAQRETIAIPGAEGLTLAGELYTPAVTGPLPGVILLHMLGSNRQAWDDTGLVETLVDNGYVVLAVDMRGHGATGGTVDWALALQDLKQVWQAFTALATVDPERTSVVGASIGANMALQTSAALPEVKTAVLLSPGLDYQGVTTAVQLSAYGPRPLLIVASEEDGYAANSAAQLAALAQGETQLELYNDAGHGTRMFAGRPDLKALILAWLDKHL